MGACASFPSSSAPQAPGSEASGCGAEPPTPRATSRSSGEDCRVVINLFSGAKSLHAPRTPRRFRPRRSSDSEATLRRGRAPSAPAGPAPALPLTPPPAQPGRPCRSSADCGLQAFAVGARWEEGRTAEAAAGLCQQLFQVRGPTAPASSCWASKHANAGERQPAAAPAPPGCQASLPPLARRAPAGKRARPACTSRHGHRAHPPPCLRHAQVTTAIVLTDGPGAAAGQPRILAHASATWSAASLAAISASLLAAAAAAEGGPPNGAAGSPPPATPAGPAAHVVAAAALGAPDEPPRGAL
jgi:hypothetical protein